MPSTALPIGRQQRLRLAYEATYGVAPVSGFHELNPYTIELNRARALVADDVLGAGFANDLDGRPAAPAIEDASGKINVPLDLGQIGFWLGALLGRVSPTGSSPLTHTFTSGVNPLPSLCLERQSATGQYEGGIGMMLKSMKFPIGPKSGYQEADLELVGAQILEPYTSTAAGTPTIEAFAGRVPASSGIVKVAGSQIGSLISGDMTVTNAIVLDRYVGNSAYPSLGAVEGQDVALSFSARYNTDVLREYGALGANILPEVQEVDFVYQLSASLSLTLACPYVRFEPVDLPTQNGKTMTVSLKGRAEVGASTPMLTATLVNSHTAY